MRNIVSRKNAPVTKLTDTKQKIYNIYVAWVMVICKLFKRATSDNIYIKLK